MTTTGAICMWRVLAQILKMGRARHLTVVWVEKILPVHVSMMHKDVTPYKMNEEIPRSFAFRDFSVPIGSQY